MCGGGVPFRASCQEASLTRATAPHEEWGKDEAVAVAGKPASGPKVTAAHFQKFFSMRRPIVRWDAHFPVTDLDGAGGNVGGGN